MVNVHGIGYMYNIIMHLFEVAFGDISISNSTGAGDLCNILC